MRTAHRTEIEEPSHAEARMFLTSGEPSGQRPPSGLQEKVDSLARRTLAYSFTKSSHIMRSEP
jgi:hypothetical protein